MKKAELNRCLVGKLRLQRCDGARHVDYRLVCAGNVVPIPTLLRLSHGDGDVANNNLGGVARALGINEHSAKQMIGCRIGRPCVLLCLSTRLLEFVTLRHRQEGEVFKPGLMAMLDSISILLIDASGGPPCAWTSEERKALERARATTERLHGDAHVGHLATMLTAHMGTAGLAGG